MTKIADSYFIDSDTGKRIPVRMEYTGVFKPDTTMITAHNVYRLNNGVAEKLDRSGWRQPNTDDPNYWKTNIRQAAENQEEPLNSVKYYWNKFTNWIKEDKNGGNMNYASYLQGGGVTPLNAAPLVSKEDIAEIITAALNGTGEIKQQATAALQEMMQDASLAPLVEQVMSEMGIPSLKCGGRVKKKALGSKITTKKVMAKGGCPCMIKKVGGRLIEVDSCTGLPIHRNGGQVKKYQNAAGAIQRADDGSYYFKDGPASRTYTAAEAKERLGAVRHNGSYYYRSPEGKIYTLKATPLNWAQSAGWSEMLKNDAGAYVLHPEVLAGLGYQKRENGSWGYGPAPAAPALPSTPQTPPAPATPTAPASPTSPTVPAVPAAPAVPTASSAAPGLFTGDLRSYRARRQWVTDNAEYLKSQGWDDARISGYKGSAQDNISLQKAISGKAAWDQQLAQQEAARNAEAAAAPVYTNQQLLDLDQAGVAGLSAKDKARYDRLQAYQANRNKALTFNGTLYADELAYNTAVNTANQTAANKYYADLAQQQNAYNGNRAMATAALSSGVQKRRQAAFDNLSSLNSGTLDYSKLSYRDIRDMQRQMRKGRRNGLYGNSEEAKEFYAAPGTGMLVPTMAQTYAGPAALTQEQLNSNTFTLKRGGRLTYSLYLSGN